MRSARGETPGESHSNESLTQPQLSRDVLSGPSSGTPSRKWRRQRLLPIGQERMKGDERALLSSNSTSTNYGTVPSNPDRKKSRAKLSLRRGLGSLRGLVIPRLAISNPGTPAPSSPAVSFVENLSTFRKRPISAYDKTNYAEDQESAPEGDLKTNGIRVWYSSFTSIDWLHDNIKDSARQARLRRRKSLRGRFQRLLDRSIGWLVVTIVGFFTAIIAFLVTRSEQWLFDFKEGYCGPAWYKSRRFCCPATKDSSFSLRPALMSASQEATCSDWRSWSEVFGPTVDSKPWLMFQSEMIEYISYVVIAVSNGLDC
jgi:chloride channel 3/4/5